MKISLGVRTAIGGVTLLLCLSIAGIYVEEERLSQIDSRRMVIHTYGVLNLLREVAIIARDADAGQRSFMLTGEHQYLDAFKRARQRLGVTISRLKELVSANPEQQNRLGALELRTGEKFAELEDTIQVRQKNGFDAAMSDWRSKQRQHQGAEINSLVGDMIDAEQASLLQREKELEASTNGTAAASLAFIFASLFAVLMTALLLYRFLDDRRKAEAKLAENARLAQLNASVSHCLTENDSLDEMMQKCADSFVRYLDVSLSRIWIRKPGSDKLALVASAGISSQLKGAHTELDGRSGLIGRILSEKRAVSLSFADVSTGSPATPNLSAHDFAGNAEIPTSDQASTSGKAAVNLSLGPDQVELFKREGLVAFSGYPLIVDGEVHGLIALFSRHEFKPLTIEALTSVSENVALGYSRSVVSIALRENASALSNFFDSAVVGMDWVDADGKILRVNEAELSLLGYGRDQFVGHNISEFHEDLSALAELLRRLADGEEVRSFPARLRCKDGSGKDVIIDSNAYFENGKFIHTRSFVRDVSIERKYELALLEKEARTRTILETAPDGIIIFHKDGEIESGNRAASKLFAWEAKALPGINLSRLLPQLADLQQDIEPLFSDQSSKGPREFSGLRADGSRVPVEVVWSQVKLHDHGLMIAVIRDITERKAAEARLLVQQSVARVLNESKTLEEASQRILAVICELTGWSMGAMWTRHDQGDLLRSLYVYTVPRMHESEMLQATRAITFKVGEGLPGIVWESGQPLWFEAVKVDAEYPRSQAALRDGIKSGCAFPIKRGDEVVAVYELFSDTQKLRDEALLQMFETTSGQIALFIERKIFEKRIIESERKFRAIFDHTFQFIGLLHADGIVIEANQSSLEFIGCAREDVVGKHFADTAWWKGDPALQKRVKEALDEAASGHFVRFEVSRVSSSGRIVAVDFTLKPVFDEHGEVALIIPEGRNISEAKEAEKRVSEFYSTVSHELRTPLTSIRGSLGLLQGGLAGALSEKALMLVKIASAESDRLIRLINDILDIRKIESGMFELKYSHVDTQELVKRTIDGITGMATEASVSLQAEFKTGGSIECDEDRIIQVLTNLISNAIKFSSPGGVVTVVLSPGEGKSFRFSVVDRGPGIPEDQIHRLFGKFQQLDQSDTRKQPGTGLGLAISKAITEQHGGRIGVESKPQEGSTFWYELPATYRPKLIGDERNATLALNPALLVDDDDQSADTLKRILEADGFLVVRTTSAEAASTALSSMRPMVIVLALSTREGSFDFLNHLAGDGKLARIPVIVISPETTSFEKESAHPSLVDWLTEPVDAKHLYDALALVRAKHGPAKVLIVEDDVATRAILKEQLSSIGIVCLEAADGDMAVEQFRSLSPDLIILDLSIAPTDGFAVVELIKQEKNNHTPLIVYSAMDLTEAQKEQLTLGNTAHLTKGTTTQEQLLNTVKSLLKGLIPVSSRG